MTAAEFLRRVKKVAAARGLKVQVEPKSGGTSHQALWLGSRRTQIAIHGKKEIPSGTVHGMLKQLGLTRKDIEE